ncbi:GNAT family N-acetyltransferase [Colwelliaceae bacterium 6441]
MTIPTDEITIRQAKETDRAFIFSLSPRLSEVAKLAWHTDAHMQKMQDDYITEVIDNNTGANITFIAEQNGTALGFIHACEHKDSISNETCGLIPLLAVCPAAQGMGIGHQLMKAAETWAKQQGYRLVHLEVFANNGKAHNFYQNLGYEAEMINMVKPL